MSLYMTIEEAAEYVGIGSKAMRQYVNSMDPPPYMMVGKKFMLQKASLEAYFEAKQEVRSLV